MSMNDDRPRYGLVSLVSPVAALLTLAAGAFWMQIFPRADNENLVPFMALAFLLSPGGGILSGILSLLLRERSRWMAITGLILNAGFILALSPPKY